MKLTKREIIVLKASQIDKKILITKNTVSPKNETYSNSDVYKLVSEGYVVITVRDQPSSFGLSFFLYNSSLTIKGRWFLFRYPNKPKILI